jgi:transmembrane sensor
LSAGKQVTIAMSGVEPIRAVNAQSELSWAEGRLVFNSTPLGEALEEFNRYNHVRLLVRDAGLASRPISGVFEASDPDTLIAFIKAGTDVSVTHEQQGTILIEPLRPADGVIN